MKQAATWALLALAAGLAALSAMPAADAPIKVFDSAVLVPVWAFLAAAAAWGYLAASPRRRRDFAIACGLNLLAVWSLCRAMLDIADCYFYIVTG